MKMLSILRRFRGMVISVGSRIKKVFCFLSSHANLLVALATFFLAILTLKYITVTTKMAEETKRLADISVEQFKIKSYPVFLVVTSPPVFNSANITQEFTINNRGEIAAHNVTLLLVSVFSVSLRSVDWLRWVRIKDGRLGNSTVRLDSWPPAGSSTVASVWDS
jgi:hypothetical protein